MFTELMIFAAFYAVAFVGHAAHARTVARRADGVSQGSHRFALYAAVLAKALAAAGHEYAVHFIVYSGYVLKGH